MKVENVLYFLAEELIAEAYKSDSIIPLEKKLIIREPHNFILSGTDRIVGRIPEKEDLDLAFFATPDVLENILKPGDPSGAMILNTLFSQIGNSRLPEAVPNDIFEIICNPESLGRAGSLVVHKHYDSQKQKFFIQWEVKGINYDPESSTTTANIFIYVADDRQSLHKDLEYLISSINMPIQRHIYENSPISLVELI